MGPLLKHCRKSLISPHFGCKTIVIKSDTTLTCPRFVFPTLDLFLPTVAVRKHPAEIHHGVILTLEVILQLEVSKCVRWLWLSELFHSCRAVVRHWATCCWISSPGVILVCLAWMWRGRPFCGGRFFWVLVYLFHYDRVAYSQSVRTNTQHIQFTYTVVV